MKHLFRKNDYIVLTIAAIFLGVFVAVQYYNNRDNKTVTASNDVLAVEIEKIAKTNSELKMQVSELTKKNQAYAESLGNQAGLDAQINAELKELAIINGATAVTGQGVIMEIRNKISEAQLVDLINSVKNIGVDGIAINGTRVILYQPLNQNQFVAPYTISLIGNGNLLESALKRKGGVVELLKQKDIDVNISRNDNITLPAARLISFNYAKIVENH